VVLVFGENCDEFLVVSDTAASDELQQLVVSVTRVNEFDEVLSLTPCYSSDCGTGQLSEKGVVRVDELQQLNAVDCQSAQASFVQRTNVTELRAYIYTVTFYTQ